MAAGTLGSIRAALRIAGELGLSETIERAFPRCRIL
jgi:hypothetical protein